MTTTVAGEPGVFHPRTADTVAVPRLSERRVGLLFAVTGLALVVLMGLLGLTMRLAQAQVIDVGPGWFYRIMTLHGAGMLTGVVLAMAVFIRKPGTTTRRNVFSEWFVIENQKIRSIYSAMFYPEKDALVPNWPPYNGNWPVLPAPK